MMYPFKVIFDNNMTKKTLKVHFASSKEANEAAAYLESVGIYFPSNGRDEPVAMFHIEVKELPEVISTLHYSGYPSEKLESDIEWMLHRFTEKGVSLVFYAFNVRKPEQIYERFVFIPVENIIAIHTIDDEFLTLTREQAKARKEKVKQK